MTKLISSLRQARQCLCRNGFLANVRGSIATALAISLPVVIGAAGMAIDLGQVYVAQTSLQNAVDAAALAGSMELPYDPEMDKGLVSAAVTEMMAKNYPDARIESMRPGGEVRSVCVTAKADVDMALMGVLGVDSKTVGASACAGFNNLEIALVLDTTGSMKGAPMNNVKEAAENLVKLIMPEGSTPSSKIGLVPFKGKVHLRAGVDGLEDGCRNADGSLNDGELLDVYKDAKYRYPKNSKLSVSSDTCSSISYVTALSSDRDDLLSEVDDLSADGTTSGTVISEGVKYGRHVLTPEAPFAEGSSDDSYRKIMIVLTDGDTEDGRCGGTYGTSTTPNNYWTNAFFGVGVKPDQPDSPYSSVNDIPKCNDGGKLNQAMLDEAQSAKDAGIEIFSIRYGTSDTTDKTLMKTIASSKSGTEDHYFDAPSADDIGDVFKKIGRQLGLRLLPMTEPSS